MTDFGLTAGGGGCAVDGPGPLGAASLRGVGRAPSRLGLSRRAMSRVRRLLRLRPATASAPGASAGGGVGRGRGFSRR